MKHQDNIFLYSGGRTIGTYVDVQIYDITDTKVDFATSDGIRMQFCGTWLIQSLTIKENSDGKKCKR